MICPCCKKKITGLDIDQIWTGKAYLDKDGKIHVKPKEATNEISQDEDCDCDIEYPRYFCDKCGCFITTDTNEATEILKEAKKK